MERKQPLIVGGVEISDEMMAAYARYARQRASAHERAVEARRARAWELARQAAELLRADFGASRVVLFGSLAGSAPFHLGSDVDLAVWDLPERQYLRAVGRLIDLDPEIDFDLVRIEEARPSLAETIARDGVAL
jgi:predicted nucleotidyltransferase